MIMKSRRSISILTVLFVSVGLSATANSACLQFPFSASDWASQGKTGGPCRISSPFGGVRTLLGATRAHQGIDFSCKEGTPIRAIIAGNAEQTGFADGGWHVVRQQSPELNAQSKKVIEIMYLHSKMWAIQPRQKVAAGDVVSYLGNEGRSTGAHLHLQTYAQNPRNGIDPASMACPGWPSSPNTSVLSADDDPSAPKAPNDLKTSTPVSPSATEMPPPPPQGLGEESSLANLYNMIGTRAFNPEYIIQLGTLEEPSLYRELAYQMAVENRMAFLKLSTKQRQESLKAAILALKNKQNSASIEQAKLRATTSGNSLGK